MKNKTEEFNIDDPRYYIALELIFSHLDFHEKVGFQLFVVSNHNIDYIV